MNKTSSEKFLEGTDPTKEMKEACRSDVPADEIGDDGIPGTDEETDSDSSSNSSSDSDSDSEYECNACSKTFTSYLSFKQHQKGKKHAKAVLKKKKEKKLLKKNDKATESDQEHIVQEPYAECNICKKEFYGPESYEQHLKCKKHKQKALEASILEQVKEEGNINVDKLRDLCKTKRTSDHVLEDVKEKMASLALDNGDEKNQEFECKDCEKVFSGLIPYAQHLMSKSHSKQAEKKNLLHKVIPGSSKEDEIPVKSELDDANTLCIEDDVLVCKSCSTSFCGPENALSHLKSKNHAKKLEKYLRKLERRKEKKRSKDTGVSSRENQKGNSEHEGHVETTEENFQSTPDGSNTRDVSNNSEENSVKSSTCSDDSKETLISYEKYKKYKGIMNSLRDDEV